MPVPSVMGFHVYPGRAYALLHLPYLGTASAFHFCFLLFTSLWLASIASLQLRRKSKHPETSKSFTNTGFLSTHYHYSLFFFFFCSTEAGLYVHIFDLRWIIAAKRVNNAAVNYRNEYLKMKPALAQPYQNRCSVMWMSVIYDLLIKISWWRKDAVIGRQERCHTVYGFWTFILVLETRI